MPRRCTVCDHGERAAIDAALIGKTDTYRHIAATYSVSTGALQRHESGHMQPIAEAVRDDSQVQEAVGQARDSALRQARGTEHFVQRFEMLQTKVDGLLGQAEAEKDVDLQVKMLAEARNLLRLESDVVLKILGMADQKDDITQEDVDQFLQQVLAELRAFPEALRAIEELVAHA